MFSDPLGATGSVLPACPHKAKHWLLLKSHSDSCPISTCQGRTYCDPVPTVSYINGGSTVLCHALTSPSWVCLFFATKWGLEKPASEAHSGPKVTSSILSLMWNDAGVSKVQEVQWVQYWSRHLLALSPGVGTAIGEQTVNKFTLVPHTGHSILSNPPGIGLTEAGFPLLFTNRCSKPPHRNP